MAAVPPYFSITPVSAKKTIQGLKEKKPVGSTRLLVG